MFLFISSQRVVGCLVAEPIKKAFRVFSASVGGMSDDAKTKEERTRPTLLHFEDISFQRKVAKRAPSELQSSRHGFDWKVKLIERVSRFQALDYNQCLLFKENLQ